MKTATLIFPHQLLEVNPALEGTTTVYIVEEYLFFRQFKFNKNKIVFHRASMKCYAHYLEEKKYSVNYIDSQSQVSDVRMLLPHLKDSGYTAIRHVDTTDDWLEKRLSKAAELGLDQQKFPSALFLHETASYEYFKNKTSYFQTDFYILERKINNILLEHGKPAGGKWSFDNENRLRYPKGKTPPPVKFPPMNAYYREAIEYTEANFPENYGEISFEIAYPVSFSESRDWLDQFFKTRFREFGPFEDAMVVKEPILNHSLLTPMLNTGLLTPQLVISEAILYAGENSVPLNSLEGFLRQIIGWREFVKSVYELRGSEERTKNFWKFKRKIPDCFRTGTTGIEPFDIVVKKVLRSGYCHHIERLMVMGNFMLLCEFDPDEVYQWFMELFIDAYDWVMVPNVYGMSQFADGGLMATKPYISGSNYLLKMSDFEKGDWQKIWDGLFWRFMDVHRSFFSRNPRLEMLVKSFDRMPEEKKENHLQNAENFLRELN